MRGAEHAREGSTRPGSGPFAGYAHDGFWCELYGSTSAPAPHAARVCPTNGLIGGTNLIRVGVARDPKQAIPLQGSYDGAAGRFHRHDGRGHGEQARRAALTACRLVSLCRRATTTIIRRRKRSARRGLIRTAPIPSSHHPGRAAVCCGVPRRAQRLRRRPCHRGTCRSPRQRCHEPSVFVSPGGRRLVRSHASARRRRRRRRLGRPSRQASIR